jgi:hypothetical protein
MMAATGSVPADLPAGDHDDDAGQTVPIIDAATCEPSAAQTFVATLGAGHLHLHNEAADQPPTGSRRRGRWSSSAACRG